MILNIYYIKQTIHKYLLTALHKIFKVLSTKLLEKKYNKIYLLGCITL